MPNIEITRKINLELDSFRVTILLADSDVHFEMAIILTGNQLDTSVLVFISSMEWLTVVGQGGRHGYMQMDDIIAGLWRP